MAFKRIFVETKFNATGSRLRLGFAVAESWGIEEAQDIECIGFFREEHELICVPKDRVLANGEPPLAELLDLENAHEEEVDLLPLSRLPRPKVLLAPSRIVRFKVTWTGRQFDLNLGKNVAEKFSKTENPPRVGVLTWKGWLVILSVESYFKYLNEPW